jgi:hypothetical protein
MVACTAIGHCDRHGRQVDDFGVSDWLAQNRERDQGQARSQSRELLKRLLKVHVELHLKFAG